MYWIGRPFISSNPRIDCELSPVGLGPWTMTPAGIQDRMVGVCTIAMRGPPLIAPKSQSSDMTPSPCTCLRRSRSIWTEMAVSFALVKLHAAEKIPNVISRKAGTRRP
jgi:hypothetical protein